RGVAQSDVLRYVHYHLKLLIKSASENRALAHETLERYREINLLYHIGETIGSQLDPQEIPQLVLEEANRVIDFDMGVVKLTALGGTDELENVASLGLTDDIAKLSGVGQLLVKKVYQSGRPDIINSTPEADLNIGLLCAPLRTPDAVLGVVLLGRLSERDMFVAGDEKLLMALTGQAALAIEKAFLHQQEIVQQRLEEELSVGRQIQLSLLPESNPSIENWEFASFYKAAHQVGGDFYDFIYSPEKPHELGLVIADVTGKGVPAALFMALSRTIIRAKSTGDRSPSAILELTNRTLIDDTRSRLFLTAFYAVLDTLSGQMTFANGGHDWPVWFQSSTGDCSELSAKGFMLGAFDGIQLENHTITIAPGDILIFFTDGVTEARNVEGHLFGEERLQATIAACTDASAEQVLQAIVDAVSDFVEDTPQSDDFSLLVIKRLGTD
ncbi:MAG: PP2C family protein-serine/threonine phosphatase, partial [Candidatus Thorarchaeota archaeon]